MKLSSLFIQGNQNYTENAGKEAQAPSVEQGLKNGMQEMAGKTPGQTISGEVIEQNGSDVLIAIGKNQLLRAKLEGSMQVNTGQLITFSIKSAGSARLVLSPLFENMGNDPTISKALQAAGIPENQTTVKMVQTMMQEGMAVDKNSLQQMSRVVNLNPEADIQTLVQLSRLKLPITEDTIFQMEAYKNYEHQITQSLMEIADSLTQTLQGLLGEGKGQEGIGLLKEVLFLLTEGAQTMAAEEKPAGGMENTSLAGAEAKIPGNGEANNPENTDLQMMLKEIMAGKDSLTEGLTAGKGSIYPGEGSSALAEEMKQAGLPEGFVQAVKSGSMTAEDFLSGLGRLLKSDFFSGEKGRHSLLHLLEGKEFSSLLKNEMSRQWLLNPKEVALPENVKNLYEKLDSQMNRLTQALEQIVKQDTPLARTVSNVSGNIDFMNQLNQTFTYVQLPLKMQNKEASGELYVYTNKKNLAKKDGEVSALLHLDMEYLGSVDVHVSMMEKRVSTKFYLADDKALDLIADHIDSLNARLEKRGYSMQAEFLKKDNNGNIMEEILKQDKNISLLSGHSFDARA